MPLSKRERAALEIERSALIRELRTLTANGAAAVAATVERINARIREINNTLDVR